MPDRHGAVDVEIMGQRFTVTSEDGEQHVRQVAAEVDAQMRRLSKGGKAVSSYTVAVLTALNIASQNLKLKEEQERIEEGVERLTRRLDARLSGDERQES